MIVTPGTWHLLRRDPSPHQFLDRLQINNTPHLGDDVFRTITSVPGTNTNDTSARFGVRGAPDDQVQIILDGMELFEPYHAPDLDGVFSMIDSEAIDGLKLMTGGFPVEYGGKLGGVFSMETSSATERHVEVGVTLSHFRFLTEGRFHDGLGEYLLSVRAGTLWPLLLLSELGSEGGNIFDVPSPGPSYNDALGKVGYQFGERFGLSFHFLTSDDQFNDTESDDFFSFFENLGDPRYR